LVKYDPDIHASFWQLCKYFLIRSGYKSMRYELKANCQYIGMELDLSNNISQRVFLLERSCTQAMRPIDRCERKGLDMKESRLPTEADHYTPAYDKHYSPKEIIEIISRALVDEPELVSVSEVGGMQTSILEIKVAKADIGKIIGKQGRTAGALRILLGAVSAKEKKRTLLEIVD
jgi:predicted RNA-binding protein YlqC (UPF0109 family)